MKRIIDFFKSAIRRIFRKGPGREIKDWPAFTSIGPALIIWDCGGDEVYIRSLSHGARFEVKKFYEKPPSNRAYSTQTRLSVIIGREAYAKMIDWRVRNFRPGSLEATARSIMIRPIVGSDPVDNPDDYIFIYKAFPHREIEIEVDAEGNRRHRLEFIIFPESDSGERARLFQIGVDSSWGKRSKA